MTFNNRFDAPLSNSRFDFFSPSLQNEQHQEVTQLSSLMLDAAMSEPKSEWGRELVEQVNKLTAEVSGLNTVVEKMEQYQEKNYETLIRFEEQLKHNNSKLEQTYQDVRNLNNFKEASQSNFRLTKWFSGIALTIITIMGGFVCNSYRDISNELKNNSEKITQIHTLVGTHGQRIDKLEQATSKLQDSLIKSIAATNNLKVSIDKNTASTNQLAANIEKDLKYIKSFVHTSEITAKFFLTSDTMKKTKKDKDSVEFGWKLIRPIEKGKVSQARVTARLGPINGISGYKADSLLDGMECRARLGEDGKSCWVEIFASKPSHILETIREAKQIPVDITITIPD